MTNFKSIVEQCLEEIRLFKNQDDGKSPNCLELFRLAVQKEDQDVFAEVYRLFQAQVKRWVFAHSGYYLTGEDAEHFVSVAFSKFYHALHGEKFARLSDFASAMKYLKLCTHSGIADYLRRLPPHEINIDDVIHPISDPSELSANLIWERIIVLLPDETDQLVARRVFVEGYKPSELLDEMPDDIQDARDVSVILQRIRRKLRSDKELQELCGMDNTDQK